MEKSAMGLPGLQQFLNDRERSIDHTIKNVQFSEIDSDEKYQKTLDRLISQFQLEEATIGGEPKPSAHRSPGIQMDFTIPITYDYSGSSELTEYLPASFGYGNSTRIQTASGNKITFDMESQTLDQVQVKAMAEKKIELTRSLVASNNGEVRQWNSQIVPKISEKLLAHKGGFGNS